MNDMTTQVSVSRRSLLKGVASLAALVGSTALLSGCDAGGDDAAAGSTGSDASAGSAHVGSASPAAGSGNVLVAYYSATGNTEGVAQTIADELGADLFAITPAQPYTSDDLRYSNPDSRVSREHDDESLRTVELETVTPEGFEGYDTVFVGYPIWWGIAAWPTDGFVSGNDFTGKRVIPFCTSASSPLGESGANLEALAGTGEWLEGQRFSGGASEDDVTAWLDTLSL